MLPARALGLSTALAVPASRRPGMLPSRRAHWWTALAELVALPDILVALDAAVHFLFLITEVLVIWRSGLLVALLLLVPSSPLFLCGWVTHQRVKIARLVVDVQELPRQVLPSFAVSDRVCCLRLAIAALSE